MDVVLGKLGPAKPVNTILLPQCWCAFCLIPVSARFAFNSTYVTITHAMGSTWAVPKTFGFVDQDGGAVELWSNATHQDTSPTRFTSSRQQPTVHGSFAIVRWRKTRDSAHCSRNLPPKKIQRVHVQATGQTKLCRVKQQSNSFGADCQPAAETSLRFLSALSQQSVCDTTKKMCAAGCNNVPLFFTREPSKNGRS